MSVLSPKKILDECKHILSLFPNFSVEFASKQANEAAYVITRITITSASLFMYQHIPQCISHLISNEFFLVKKSIVFYL